MIQTQPYSQRRIEAQSWANFWTGLAVASVAVSVLPAAFAFAGMGIEQFIAAGPMAYGKMASSVGIGCLLGRTFQRQAIVTLRNAPQD